MKRRSFTLIEVLVSVAILSIIVLFLVNSSFNLQKGYESLFNKEKKTFADYEVTKTIYEDILEASKIEIKEGRKYDVLNLQTKNSLYQREEGFVSYAVLKNSSLIRLEKDDNTTLPLSYDETYKTDFLIVKENIEEFKIIQNLNEKKKDFLLFYLKAKDQTPVYYEIGLINSGAMQKKQPQP